MVRGSDTVSDVKAQIQDKEDIALDDHVLFFRGKALNNSRTLTECKVRRQSWLALLPRLRGGMSLELTNDEGKKIAVNVELSDTELNLQR